MRYYEISIKDNPTFATNKESVKVDSIIENGYEVVKEKRKWWQLHKEKYHISHKEYKRQVPISEIEDGSLVFVLEIEYPDRYFEKGKFHKLRINGGLEIKIIDE